MSDSAKELGALLHKHQQELADRDRVIRRAQRAFQQIRKRSTDPIIRDICNQQLGDAQREIDLTVE